jgi:hypothetical protein
MSAFDAIAHEYVRLVLAVGVHDKDYVDAYYGPAELRAEVEAQAMPLAEIRESATSALDGLGDAGVSSSKGEDLDALRQDCLRKQLQALVARVDMLSGVKIAFDEESKALYDVVAPERPDEFYAEIVASLEPLLPGGGSLNERYERLRSQFYVPSDRLAATFGAAIDAARERTKRYIELPEEENFSVEYVKDRVWGAYNWYKGNAHSLIQVNTDSPLPVNAMIGLACHEGYPGHHVYNALLEKHLARERGWEEFTVYPLYSPQSLIAEGTAEYGVELCFPREERRAFEREVLFPLAGLELGSVDEYDAARELLTKLGYASNDAARRYLDGEMTREETKEWLIRYALVSPERVERSIRFMEHNRSYVVTYNVGLDMVREWVEARASDEAGRWREFTWLLSTPQVPSNL